MYLILAHRADELAAALYYELAQRTAKAEVVLLFDDQLAAETDWSHWQEAERQGTELRLADGRCLSALELKAVFNRLRFVAVPHFKTAPAYERDYAMCEIFALLLSWLASLPCPVINPASARGLGGAERSLLEWLQLAEQAGLRARQAVFATNARYAGACDFQPYQPMAGMRLSQVDSYRPVQRALIGAAPTLFLEPLSAEAARMLVVGETVLGELQALAPSCLQLARLSQTSLLECFFARATQPQANGATPDWLFCWANAFPPQLAATEISALAELLMAPVPTGRKERKRR